MDMLLNHTPPLSHVPCPTSHSDRFAETRRLQALWVTASQVWMANPCTETQQLRQEAHAAYAHEQAAALGLAQLLQRMKR